MKCSEHCISYCICKSIFTEKDVNTFDQQVDYRKYLLEQFEDYIEPKCQNLKEEMNEHHTKYVLFSDLIMDYFDILDIVNFPCSVCLVYSQCRHKLIESKILDIDIDIIQGPTKKKRLVIILAFISSKFKGCEKFKNFLDNADFYDNNDEILERKLELIVRFIQEKFKICPT